MNTAQKDIETKFMHPFCPSRSYTKKHFLFTENSIHDYMNRETVLFTQWQSKIYPRCSTLISFHMMSINTVTISMF